MLVTAIFDRAMRIDGAPGLDPIHVFFVNVEPGRGYITVICNGCAWTAYFGAMSGQTIQEFVQRADVEYLVSKMGMTPFLKQSRKHDAFLGNIITAIKQTLGNTTGL